MYTDTVVPLLRLMASIEGDNVVVFYYLCSLEIWLDMRDITFGMSDVINNLVMGMVGLG
jgi:hypothetical protein